MRSKKKSMLWLTGIIVILLGLLAGGSMAGSRTSAAEPSPIDITTSAILRGDTVMYSFTLRNASSYDVGDVFVAGTVPRGSIFAEALVTPDKSWFRGFEASGTELQSAVWLVSRVPASGIAGPFTYVISRGTASDLNAHVWARWKSPADGTVRSPDASPFLNLTALHNPSSSQYNGDCLSCHGDIMNRPTLNPRIQEAHTVMMPFVPGYAAAKGVTNENCTFCHSGSDLRDHSAGNLRRDVNVASCTACHGPQGSGKTFYVR